MRIPQGQFGIWTVELLVDDDGASFEKKRVKTIPHQDNDINRVERKF